jgi:hypothetical protein
MDPIARRRATWQCSPMMVDGGGAWTKSGAGRWNSVADVGQEAREGWRDVVETLR